MPEAQTGSWMRDPKSRQDDIYVLKDNIKVNRVFQFKDEIQLSRGNESAIFTMPFRCTGTGHVIYNGSLFCNKFASNRLMKFTLHGRRVRSRRLQRAKFNNTASYSSGANTDLDFAVDEVGLWVIFASEIDIMIGRVDPDTLAVRQTWLTNIPKQKALNTFMICGRLYIVVKRDSHIIISHVFDTQTGNGRDVEIPLMTSSDYVIMLDYNPKDSKLYSWEMNNGWEGDLVLYDVYFKE
ncbi:hypothetical protein CAPTEDRAFT_137529 [Capitella teleta]|uniref:Olfactomedin-like domain-containing protein n=1 Tax=Capitella teleta TaxID=283909 RepID=R7TIT0_CAPTE|nr:hypothetical protein CAPTEDRAFT_137529 [Capitella teleta]|eukprot:ELT93372.1 hypothetical protein CAPTEDRAFT_137529 [Capitella teleta]